MRRIAVIGLALALPLAGCATRPPEPVPARAPVRAPPPRAVPQVREISPASYIAQAASIDLFVIRSSELALARSRNGFIRDFARRMVAAHQGTAAQLSLVGRRLNLLPQARMTAQHQLMYDELARSGSFDATYLRLQRAIHRSAFSLHSTYSRRGRSPSLKPVAANAEAVERQHLDRLRRL